MALLSSSKTTLAPDTSSSISDKVINQRQDVALQQSKLSSPQFVTEQLEAVQKLQHNFEESELRASRLLEGGAERNLASSQKSLDNAGFFDDKTAMRKMRDADKEMLHQREEKRVELEARLKESKAVTEAIKELENRRVAIEKEIKEITDIENKNKLLTENSKIERSEHELLAKAKELLTVTSKVDTSEYQRQMREVGEHLDRHVNALNKTETVLRVTQKGLVITAAAGVTVMTAGAGTGLMLAAAEGTLAGTGVGALQNTTEAIGDVARGNKSTGEAAQYALKRTVQDAATAASTSASIAVSGGLTNLARASGAVTSEVGVAIVSKVVAPAAGSAINSTVNRGVSYFQAEHEFNSELSNPSSSFKERWGDPSKLTSEQIEHIKHEFLTERGLTFNQIAKDVAIDGATGALAGYVGGKVEVLREGAKTGVGKILTWGLDVAADSAVTLASTAAHKGEINSHVLAESMEAVVVARSVAKVTNVAGSKTTSTHEATLKPQLQKGSSVAAHGHVHEGRVGMHTGSVVDRTVAPSLDGHHSDEQYAQAHEAKLSKVDVATTDLESQKAFGKVVGLGHIRL